MCKKTYQFDSKLFPGASTTSNVVAPLFPLQFWGHFWYFWQTEHLISYVSGASGKTQFPAPAPPASCCCLDKQLSTPRLVLPLQLSTPASVACLAVYFRFRSRFSIFSTIFFLHFSYYFFFFFSFSISIHRRQHLSWRKGAYCSRAEQSRAAQRLLSFISFASIDIKCRHIFN